MNKFSFSILIFCFAIVEISTQDYVDENNTDENKNATFYYTTTREGTCVKIYYSGQDFYKVHCFEILNNRNNSLGIVTDKNDTILYAGYGKHSECFDIHKSKAKNHTTVCLNATLENCVDDIRNEQRHKPDKMQEIPCKRHRQINYLGFHFEKLNVIFRCVVYSLETPNLSTKEKDKIRVRYCFNRKITDGTSRSDKLWTAGLKILDKIFLKKSLNETNGSS